MLDTSGSSSSSVAVSLILADDPSQHIGEPKVLVVKSDENIDSEAVIACEDWILL